MSTTIRNPFDSEEEDISTAPELEGSSRTTTKKNKSAPKRQAPKKQAKQKQLTPALSSDSEADGEEKKRKRNSKTFLDESEDESSPPIIAQKLTGLLWRRVASGYTSQRNFSTKGEYYIDLRVSYTRDAEAKDAYKNTLVTYKSCVGANSNTFKAVNKVIAAAKQEFKNIQPVLYRKEN